MFSRTDIKHWFFERVGEQSQQKDKWFNVMCLTGVDYFSSLGFAPAMAFLFAGVLSPFATLLLVILNLFGAYPMYAKVAELSPNGQGSVALLQKLLPSWWGKLLVITLLGFASTGFLMTITLCSSDAAKHVIENPWSPVWLQNQLVLTVFLVAFLGAVFLKGFKDAIWLAVILAWSFLFLTACVFAAALNEIIHHPQVITNWYNMLFGTYTSIWQMVAISLLAFPKLALGMSGFETGVAVMPLIKGSAMDTSAYPAGRIRNTKYLLLTAAIIMSFCLLTSSFITTTLIPAHEFAETGKANGRALAYLAHGLLGHVFGTVYDVSTLLILWFAGASAMAGLLNLIPRYLPVYGMAPEWVAALRPLVLLITGFSLLIVWHFNADVDAQAGAFATGLLVFMTSAALAATIASWKVNQKQGYYFLIVTLVFVYATINIILERPDGIQIAGVIILFMMSTSILSRCIRSTELRVGTVNFDRKSLSFVEQMLEEHLREIRLLAHRPGGSSYEQKEQESRQIHSLQENEGNFIFLEVTPTDPSEFHDNTISVTGHNIDGHNVWRCDSASVPNAIAAILLTLRNRTGQIPHVYFGWTEGHPLAYVLKYVLWGEGESAPLTREILRSAEPNPKMRPRVHVS
ncbi:MAG: hypothetical protein K2Y22_08390 [Candidatus Obscuribacterales bacterium]|nr:hypothetical protein [Candidatus Obscuribacterales bacterium]